MKSKPDTGTDEVSLCLACYCATKTIKGKCGKCKADKPVTQATEISVPSNTGTEWEKQFDKEFGFYTRNFQGTELCDENKKVKDFIRTLLSNQAKRYEDKLTKQEAEHKKELQVDTDTGYNAGYTDGRSECEEAYLVGKQQGFEEGLDEGRRYE